MDAIKRKHSIGNGIAAFLVTAVWFSLLFGVLLPPGLALVGGVGIGLLIGAIQTVEE